MKVGTAYIQKHKKQLLSLSDSWRTFMAIDNKKPYYYKGELAAIVNVTYSHLSRIIKNLEVTGLVKTNKVGRIRLISKTELGDKIMAQITQLNSMLDINIV